MECGTYSILSMNWTTGTRQLNPNNNFHAMWFLPDGLHQETGSLPGRDGFSN